jgi:protocatechuate 3,4-dioxygenase beta subunit
MAAPPVSERRAAIVAEPDVVPEAAEPVAVAPARVSVRGRVLDVERRPVAGVFVEMLAFGSDEPVEGSRVRSEGDGTFEMHTTGLGDITIADERYAALLSPTLFRTAEEEVILVVAPRQTVAGIVVDSAGTPLEDAKIVIDLKDGFHATFGYALDHSRVIRWTTTTDAEGRFSLDEAPRTEYGLLVTTRAGFAPDIRALPLEPTFDLEIVMGVPDDERALLEGVVVDAEGQPVEDAYVACEYQNGKTDAKGRFSLDLNGEGERGVLMAIKAGMQPAQLMRAGDSNIAPDAWPDPLVLRLGGAPLAIEGRVLDADGEPLAGVKVWTADTTHFGAIEHEDFGPRMTVAASVEALLNGQGFGTTKVTTDDDGRFTLEGLIEKDYTVSVHDERSLASHRTEPVAAGSMGLVIRVDAAEVHERVAGRVVSPDGEPVVGASVVLGRYTEPASDEHPYREALETSSVVTDEDGAFEFKNVTAPITHARISGSDIDLDNKPSIEEGDDIEALELVVARRCRLRIELGDPNEADSFGLLDANGETVHLTIFRGNLAWSSATTNLAEGQSESVNASEAARTLVLYKEHVEVRRVDIQLRPGEANVLQP